MRKRRRAIAELLVTFPDDLNEQGRPMIWFASWLVGADGAEGGWFHSDRGAASVRVAVPGDATGVRIRRWPSDGMEAEYADVLGLHGREALDAAALDFDTEQPFSRLPALRGA